jgi:hypothetical protein
MAYTLDIEWDFDHEPICDAFGTQRISFMLGYDLVDNTTFFMVVRLTTDQDGLYDLRFGIEERENDKPDWTLGMDYHIEVSKRLIPKKHRSAVLDMIISALEAIIANCTPQRITMQTYHQYLPAKAMAKYIKIEQNLKKWGYETTVDTEDGTTGIHYWLFEECEEGN